MAAIDSSTPSEPGARLWQVDALRGLMLVLMTLTHLPTVVAGPAGQPFGFVSAAEGFVLLSGFMAGMVYAARERREGRSRMRSAFYRRVGKIYLCQAALLLFLFSVIALIAVVLQEEAITGLLEYYLQEPLHALVGGLLLIYSPPLLDILPLYVLLMLVSPVLLLHGLRRGWGGILALSVALWLAAQFKFGAWVYEALAPAAGIRVPLAQTGAFDVLAWQFPWVLGLWLGAGRSAQPPQPVPAFPRWMLVLATAIAAIGFVWRHVVGQVPLPHDPGLNLLFDKWQLAPLRLLNLFALLVLALHWAPWLARHLPRVRALEVMGAASLPVFCVHLVLALLALSLFGAPTPWRPLWIDAAILAVSFAVLYAVALLSRELDRLSATPRPAAPGAARSPPSTTHSHPR
ncbi:OpgC domain-containing protein [Pseudorhodoferax sp.]|uniref:OpgC domain-containing protein n=1 Tax=Pseudorhodoferax sp. TaxID=1993553 RepID=UPI0039E3DB4E